MNRIIYKIVSELGLNPHPEGGVYKETYRSTGIIDQSVLEKFVGDRNYCTAIYFLLTSNNFSAFHKIKQDEIWHHYQGSSLHVHVIDHKGNYKRHTAGTNITNGEYPQHVVPVGCWFASSVANSNAYSLVGCTVSPGFDFDDFVLAKRVSLIQEYPQHEHIITQYTRN